MWALLTTLFCSFLVCIYHVFISKFMICITYWNHTETVQFTFSISLSNQAKLQLFFFGRNDQGLVHLYTIYNHLCTCMQPLCKLGSFRYDWRGVQLCNCATVELCNCSRAILGWCKNWRLSCRSALVRLQSVQKSKLASWHRLADPFLVKPENTWWFSHTPYFRDGWVWSPAVKREPLSPI